MLKGFRVTPLLERDPLQKRYADEMAELVKKRSKLKPRPIKPEGMSDEDFIFSLQAKSTQEIIIKQKDPDYVRDWTAPLPDNVLANPAAKSLDELVGARPLTVDEIFLHEDVRRKSKNTDGQSMKSSVSDESKERAVHHFLVSPPAPSPSDKERISQLTKIKEFQPPDTVWRSLSWTEALAHWFKGGKVETRQIMNQTYWGYWSQSDRD